MNSTASLPIVPIALGIVGVIFLLWVIGTLNRFTQLQNAIRESWSNVDVALKRRYDLIPNLVETCKAYAAHEEAVFSQVVEARNRAMEHTGALSAQARSERELGQAVGALLARVEAYPELRASAHFLELQRELTNTEDRIAAARRFYNANVRDFNVAITSFPGAFLAGGRKAAEFFEVDSLAERDPVRVG